MQPVGVAHSLCAADGRYQAPATVFINQVFDDRPRFGDGHCSIHDYRRFSQRVNLQQHRRSQHRFGVAFVALDLVRYTEFLEQPQHPLRPGVVEVMNNDHCADCSSPDPWSGLTGSYGSLGANHAALALRNSGMASQRAATAPRPGYATASRLMASASLKKVYTQVEV